MAILGERDAVWLAETGLYIFLEALLLVWAFTTDYIIDTGPLGFGEIDFFFTMAMAWICIVFSTKSTIAFLKRRSWRAISDEWKGPITDIKPTKYIKAESVNEDLAVNQLAIYPTGGTSKPSVRGMSGVRFLIFPHFYSETIGGNRIIMAKLQSYPKGKHGNILYHIIDNIKKLKGYKYNKTMIMVGEDYDPKFAVDKTEGWVVSENLISTSNLMAEASINRNHNDKAEDSQRIRMELRKYGVIVEDEVT